MTTETPNTIYLIPDGDGHTWCDSPDPGIAMDASDAIRYMLMPVTSAKGCKMPLTEDCYQANAIRDQELIMEQKAEISKLKQKLHNLNWKHRVIK